MARLSLEGLSKVYPGGVIAVDGFTLEVADHEFVAVVGPSGCGKSTLLRMIAGLEEESAGRILLDGRLLNGVPPKDRDMAIMFQNYALFPHMTVFGNMAFGLRLRRTKAEEVRRRVEAVAGTLGLTELLARYPGELSGGQRQRAALGRAILRSPQVFLFDEPLSNLDAKMRAQMRVEISRLHQDLKSTMIFVTHDQVEAMTMGDRIVVLKNGLIQQVADPTTLYEKPANTSVATFIGSPGMNLFQGSLEEEAGKTVFRHTLFTFPLGAPDRARLGAFSGRDIVLGIRPEDLGSPAARAPEDAPRLRGRITVVERLGGQACLYLESEGAASTTFTARVEKSGGWQAGQSVELPLLVGNGVFFDPATGNALP